MSLQDGLPVRVLFVLGSLGGGGAERCMVDLLKRFDRSQCLPQLFLAYRTGELLPEVPQDVPVWCHVNGPIEATLSQRLAAKFRLLSEARACQLNKVIKKENIDLVFSWSARLSYESALASLARPVARVAYCVAEPEVELADDFLLRTPWRWHLAKWTYASANRVFANSVGVRDRLTDLYRLPSEQVELFRNLRDFARLDNLADEFQPQWPSDGTRIVTVGRLHYLKGHACLLRALAELVHRRHRTVQLLIVGQGPEEESLKLLTRDLNLADRVAFTGFQSNPMPFYQHSDLFVMPSLSEGLPNVLIEAVAMGIPSISADCPTGPREILEDGKLGVLVPPNDEQALATAIEQTIDRFGDAKSSAKEAKSAIRAKYDIELGIADLESRLIRIARDFQSKRGGR